MNITAVALASLTLASAGVASGAYAASVSDMDYLKASRCRGIAKGLGADASAIEAYLKRAGGGRSALVVSRANEEFAKGKRQSSSGDGKERLQAELSGPCAAYSAA